MTINPLDRRVAEEIEARKQLRGAMTSHERAVMDISEFIDAGLQLKHNQSSTHPLLKDRIRRASTSTLIAEIEGLLETLKSAEPSEMKTIAKRAMSIKKAVESSPFSDIEDLEVLQYATLLIEALDFAKRRYVTKMTADSFGFGADVFTTIFGDRLGTWLLTTPKKDIEKKSLAELRYSIARSKTEQQLEQNAQAQAAALGPTETPSAEGVADAMDAAGADISAEEKEAVTEAKVREREVDQKEDKVITLLERILGILEKRPGAGGGAGGAGDAGTGGEGGLPGFGLDDFAGLALGALGLGGAGWGGYTLARMARARALMAKNPEAFARSARSVRAAMQAAKGAKGLARVRHLLRLRTLGMFLGPGAIITEIVSMALEGTLEHYEEEIRKNVTLMDSGIIGRDALGRFYNMEGQTVTTQGSIDKMAQDMGISKSHAIGLEQLRINEEEVISKLESARGLMEADEDQQANRELIAARVLTEKRAQFLRTMDINDPKAAEKQIKFSPDGYKLMQMLLQDIRAHYSWWETSDRAKWGDTKTAIAIMDPNTQALNLSDARFILHNARTSGVYTSETAIGEYETYEAVTQIQRAEDERNAKSAATRRDAYMRKLLESGGFNTYRIEGDGKRVRTIQLGRPSMLNPPTVNENVQNRQQSILQLDQNAALQNATAPNGTGSSTVVSPPVVLQQRNNQINNSTIVSDGVVEDQVALSNRERTSFLRSENFMLA